MSSKGLKEKNSPERKDLRTEITRRYYVTTKCEKKYKGWKTTRSKAWSHKHPVEDTIDVNFIKNEELAFNNITKASNE